MNQAKCLSYLLMVVLVFLSIAEHVIASPTNIILTVLRAPPHEVSAHQLEGAHFSPPQPAKSTLGIPPLLPRADDFNVLPMTNLKPGWELDFHEFDWGYLPIHSASIVLQGFYNRVFDIATSNPGSMPDHSIISWGQLELEIIASQGAVAWASVATFAAHMLQTARRGYTNSYHCMMINAAGGVWISFNLYVSATKELAPPVPRIGA